MADDRVPPTNQQINGWLVSALLLVVLFGLPVMFCTGMTSGLTANANRVTVREVHTADGAKTEFEDRPMTSRERMTAAQLGADEAFYLEDGRVLALTGEAAVLYVKDGERLVPKETPKKQD